MRVVKMNSKIVFGRIRSESFLLGILYLIGLISLCNDNKKRGRPYVYPTTVILRCFVVRIWMRIPSNNALHYYFSIETPHNSKVMKSCGLHSLPDRRAFDRRFKVLPIQSIITSMRQRFLRGDIVQRDAAAADSAILECKTVWYTKGIHLKRYRFFCSRKGQKIIRRRNSIERMFDRIKDTFVISYLPVKRRYDVTSYVLMCVLVYQLAIYYNCMMGVDKPQCVKHMLGN